MDETLYGKWYADRLGRHVATELLSIGLQELYHAPQGLAENDPEFFDFIIGLIRKK